MKYRKTTDGFAEMINKDHRGAKPDKFKVVAEYVSQFNGINADEIAAEIIRWLEHGDLIE